MEAKKMKEDKIINNSFNTGSFGYEEFSTPMKIDDRVASQYEESLTDNIVEIRTLKMLQEKIYDHFSGSEYFEKYKNPKRVDKGDMVKMYYFFKERLMKENNFSLMEIFMGFAEFFQINYVQLYAEIGVKDKELLLKELHDKYHLTNKLKTKQLF